MSTVWLLSVSFFLFCKGVIAAPPYSSDSFGSVVSNRRTLLKPYMRQYGYLYNPYKQNKGRCLLSATLKHTIKEPLSSDKWKQIYEMPKTPKRYFNDFLNTNDSVTLNIYEGVLYLLLKKIYTWVNSENDVESISHYLGYEEKTVNLINMSMTELFSQQRKHLIRIDALAKMFYYSCDVESMIEGNDLSRDRARVRRRFTDFIIIFEQIFEDGSDIYTVDEDTLVEKIEANLRLIDAKTNASFGVTISSMKLWILLYDTDDKEINLIKNRLLFLNKTCTNLTWFYTKEDESNKVNAYHLKILGIVATHVFGYAYNHFELVYYLRKFRLDAEDRQVIKQFNSFLSAYMSVFIDRYFEFSGEISQQLVDALFSLMFFLDPNNPQTPDVKNLTEEEKLELNQPPLPIVSTDNYFDDEDIEDKFDGVMWDLIKNAFQLLIETFTEYDRNSWNRLTDIEYEEYKKEYLIDYMITNNTNAMDVLEKFAKELTIDQSLYET